MPLLSVCFGFLPVVLSLRLCAGPENHPASVFLSARIMAAAFGGRFISSPEAQRILLSTHYSANCIYPGENHGFHFIIPHPSSFPL